MSKVGQEVFEGQEFAQNYYNLSHQEFKVRAKRELSVLAYEAAVEEHNVINIELTEFFTEEHPTKVLRET
tara:strand:- start:213 stop:422 length:210 start_codon:yes stop_codon:yes gene_type:complete